MTRGGIPFFSRYPHRVAVEGPGDLAAGDIFHLVPGWSSVSKDRIPMAMNDTLFNLARKSLQHEAVTLLELGLKNHQGRFTEQSVIQSHF